MDIEEAQKYRKLGTKYALKWLIKHGQRETAFRYDSGRFVIDLNIFDDFAKKNGIKVDEL